MKSRRASVATAVVFVLAMASTAQYRLALPGYRYSFPRDYFNHPDFRTEWWYYTGNVKAADGHRFGFELTFFREGVDRQAETNWVWDVRDVYLAHLALSDLDGGKFFHVERTNRAGPGIAGASERERRIWNGNWEVKWRDADQLLQAVDERFTLQLALRSEKSPVVHGQNGVSQKAEGPGRASHYFSLTRLNTSGQIQLHGRSFEVTGTAWMDHEFFTQQLSAEQVGWDWMSIQLQDHSELMLYRIRRKDGSIDPYSSGTFVGANGHSAHLRRGDFEFVASSSTWTSPATHGVYPLRWKISIPELEITLDCSALLPSQELTSSAGLVPAYWEGAVALTGSKNKLPVTGVGYLEMTGYDRPVEALR